MALWARFEGALRVLSFLSAARPVFLIFAPLPWILPMSARLEKLHRLICTRPRLRKNPSLEAFIVKSAQIEAVRAQSLPNSPRVRTPAFI